jgi:uncharacterized protein YidB (DUF937 family)
MGILDSILGGAIANPAGGNSGGGNTRMLLLMGLLAMIASRSGGAQGQDGEGGGLLGTLGGALGGMLGGGAAAGGAGAGGLGGLLGGLLGGAQSPQSTGAGALATSPGDLIGALGGLGGLTQVLESGGLGDAVRSWVGTGANQAVSADQVTQALGPGGQLQQLANTAGVSQDEAAQQLSSLLPEVVNHLTPNGDVPQGQLDLASLAQHFLGERTGT